MLTVAAAFLSGTFLEIFLYGVYTVLFSTVMYLFHRQHRIPGRKSARWVLLGLVLQFVTIPAVLVFTEICDGGVVYRFVKSHPGELPLLLNAWATGTLVLSIMTSVYGSAMISWKICRVTRALSGLSERISGSMRLTSVLAILVESAMLQTATTISIVVSFQLGSTDQYIVLAIAPAVFGISTVLIHVRIGLGWAHDCSGHTGTNPTRISFAANESRNSEEQELGHPGHK
ncbi:hypothetical protein C8R44DRAFT_891757 [Mycena epipterygia]|nr:hypothetical protein C8R44DRAFT_891757 [Mycena epipterygia]